MKVFSKNGDDSAELDRLRARVAELEASPLAGRSLEERLVFEKLLAGAVGPLREAARAFVEAETAVEVATTRRAAFEQEAARRAAEDVAPAEAAFRAADGELARVGAVYREAKAAWEAAQEAKAAADLALAQARHDNQAWFGLGQKNLSVASAEATRNLAEARARLRELGVDDDKARLVAKLGAPAPE